MKNFRRPIQALSLFLCSNFLLAIPTLEEAVSEVRTTLGASIDPQLSGFLDAQRYQEAIWFLNGKKQRALGENLRDALSLYMSTAEIAEVKPLGGGSTPTEKVTFKNGVSAAFKAKVSFWHNGIFLGGYLSTNIRSERAAYLIDEMLELDIVPMTVLRDVNGRYGSLQYFVKDAVMVLKAPENKRQKPARLMLLDFLIKNIDRGPTNFMYLASMDRHVGIDCSWSLRNTRLFSNLKALGVDKRSSDEKKRKFPKDAVPSHEDYVRLKNLQPEEIRKKLDGLIHDEALDKLVKRRVKVLKSLENAGASSSSSD